MDPSRNRFPTTELGRHDRLALGLCLDRQKPTSRDIRVKKTKIRIPSQHRIEHRLPLQAIRDDMHVRAGYKLHASPPRMDVDHRVGDRKQLMGQIMGDLARYGTFGVTGKSPIEVHSIDRR